AKHDDVMPAGRGDGQRTFGELLPLHVGEIDVVAVELPFHLIGRGRDGLDGREPGDDADRVRQRRHAETSISRTTAASRAFAVGTISRLMSRARASIAIDNAPATGRTVPSSASSPTDAKASSFSAVICPVEIRKPIAMGRSNAPASFRKSAGARLITVRPKCRR